jgi:hypothetical protein
MRHARNIYNKPSLAEGKHEIPHYGFPCFRQFRHAWTSYLWMDAFSKRRIRDKSVDKNLFRSYFHLLAYLTNWIALFLQWRFGWKKK